MKLLSKNPADRGTMSEALKDPFFQTKGDEAYKKIITKIPLNHAIEQDKNLD